MDDETGESEDDDFVIRLDDGVDFLDASSALQKMIRRGLEEDALVVAVGLFDNGYGMALARRLPMIAAEDVGLAAPDVVARVCMFCMTWLTLKKEAGVKKMPDSLPLLLAVMLMCRSEKNRECDDAGVVIRELIKRGEKTVKDVITNHEELIVDSHTRRGKQALRRIATDTGRPYDELAWRQFYEEGAVLHPLKEINGNPYAHRAYAIWGLDYSELKHGKKAAKETK